MKRVFYYTDVLPFLGQGECALDKLIHNLDLFHGLSDDVKLIWHPWSGTKEYLEKNESKILERYNSILEDYRSEGWGELDESSSYEEM